MTRCIRRAARGLTAVLVLVALALVARADILHMKDGRKVDGVVLEETKTLVKIKTRLGVLEFKRSDIERIERKKSKVQEFDERWAKAESAADFHALGLWAEGEKMRKEAKRSMRKAVEVDPMHESANVWLGNVLYDGRWVTPEERERLVEEADVADRRARGLVKYGDRWVTPEEKANLDAGLVLHDGEWMTFEAAQRAKGLEEVDGRWIERTEALALQHMAKAEELAGVAFEHVVTAGALIAGRFDIDVLREVAEGLTKGREWFDEEFGVEPGLELLGDRRAEFYVFDTNSAPYEDTVAYFAGLTTTLPEGWSPIAKKSYGFFWTDPYPMSSARQFHRGQREVVGHCYHHWGHMLLGRLAYDGRLLPPWYEESFASLVEFKIHGQNRVFCRARTTVGTGTVSTGNRRYVDPAMVRDGDWRQALKTAIREKQVLTIDKLYQLDFSDLEVIDIATGMGLLEWIDAQGDDALRKFHTTLRYKAPKAPKRLLETGNERQALNDLAFQNATGMTWREADRAWQGWFLSR